MSVAGRKLTIRLPDARQLHGAEVVGVHFDPGNAVRDGGPVVTLHTVHGEHVVRAPRRGSAVPLVSVGDTVVAGDPLFILNVDEDALSVSKDLRRRTMMRSGVAAVTKARRTGRARKPEDRPMRPEPHRIADPDSDDGELLDWMKPGFAMAIYAMAAVLLLPVFSQLGGEASGTEIVIMVGLAVAVAALMAIFLSPGRGRWPRWAVRLIAISWLMLSSAVLFTRVMQPPDFVVAGAGREDARRLASDGRLREMPFGDATGLPAAVDPMDVDATGAGEVVLATGAGHAGPVPGVIRASEVLAGQTDLIPMPHMPLPDRLGHPPGAPAALTRRLPGDVPAVPRGIAIAALATPGAADGAPASTGGADAAAIARVSPGKLPDPAPVGDGGVPGPLLLDLPAAPRDGTAAGGDAAPAGAGGAPSPDAATMPGDATSDAREADPVRLVQGDTGSTGWLEAQIGLVGAAGQVAAGGPGTRVEAADAARMPWGASVPAAIVRVDAAPGPAWLGVVEGVPEASAADGGELPTSAILAGLPASARQDRAQPVAGSPDPVMLAALRAGDTAWMETQAERADGAATDAGDLPSAGGTRAGETARWTGATAEAGGSPRLAQLDDGAGTIRIADHGAPSIMPLIQGRPTPSAVEPDPVLAASPGPAPVIAAIGPDLVAGGDPADAPRVPPPGAAPATRMLLYLFFDDPRLDQRPGVGDAWAADLPPGVAGAVWANTVVAEHGIVQVDSWCGGDGADARRAWLSDRIRLLQVRVEIDPDMVDAFEAALPVFGDQPPGFFHNRRPLIGGTADAPLMALARRYLRDMPGGGFFDDAAALTRAMQDAGCTGATWNGGEGPANTMGTELSIRFGS